MSALSPSYVKQIPSTAPVVTSSSFVSNIIAEATEIPVDYSYVVASELKVEADLTISGTLRITG